MKWALQIGRVFGIPVRLHITFPLSFLAVALFGKDLKIPVPSQYYAMGLVCAMFAGVLVHELAHSLMARRFGVKVEGITLLPIGGVAQMTAMPRSPWQEMVIAITGPVTSLVLAAVFGLLYAATATEPIRLTAIDLFRGGIFPTLFAANLILALFNLIPAFPLDGGRVLRSVLAIFFGRERGTLYAVGFGEFIAIVLFFYGVFNMWWLALVAMFIYIGAQGERAEAELLVDLSRGRAKDAMFSPFISVPFDATLGDALETFRRSAQQVFPVVENEHTVGMLGRSALLEAKKQRPANTPVTQIMAAGVITTDEDGSLQEVYQRMQEEDQPAAMVLSAGKPVGVIDLKQIDKYEALGPEPLKS